MALKIIEDERCQNCGLPIWIAHSEDSRIDFELDHIVCFACEFEGKETSKKSYKPVKGHTPYVVPVLEAVEGEPDKWPTRKEHHEIQVKKAIAKAEKAQQD